MRRGWAKRENEKRKKRKTEMNPAVGISPILCKDLNKALGRLQR